MNLLRKSVTTMAAVDYEARMEKLINSVSPKKSEIDMLVEKYKISDAVWESHGGVETEHFLLLKYGHRWTFECS